VAPVLESSTGIQVNPCLAVGGFGAVVPLADIHALNLGPDLVGLEAAFAAPSGTEVLFTPWYDQEFYPLFRVAVGGISLGYLEDTDDQEGYERAVHQRFFYASGSVGMEWKVLSVLRVGVRGEWSWAPHRSVLGLDAGAAGGPSLVFNLRTQWKTIWGDD